MKRSDYATNVQLGPVPCQGCRRPLVLVKFAWRDYLPGPERMTSEHRYGRGRHDCPALPAGVRRKMERFYRWAKAA